MGEGEEKHYLGRAPAGPRLHWAMISSKAWRCSRSRRRSSSAMCRFQGGNPAARSPDAISAAGRGGRGRDGQSGRRGRQGGGWSAGRARALSEPGSGSRPRPHTRHGAELRQGPSHLCSAQRPRQRLPCSCLTPSARFRRHRPQHRCPQAGKRHARSLYKRGGGVTLRRENKHFRKRRGPAPRHFVSSMQAPS